MTDKGVSYSKVVERFKESMNKLKWIYERSICEYSHIWENADWWPSKTLTRTTIPTCPSLFADWRKKSK